MATRSGDPILILGGCGFLGRALISELHRRGHLLRVVTRRSDRHRDLLVFPTLTLVEGDIHDERALVQFAQGCQAIVNLVGIFAERSPYDFQRLHEELPARIGRVAGGRRVVHVSAMGASLDAPSAYLRSKAAGEVRLRDVAPQAVIVRPHILYGPHDRFVCRFARWLRWSPLAFPIPFPKADLRPVHVADVSAALGNALAQVRAAGQIYELCGPEAVTLQRAVDAISQTLDLRVLSRPLSLQASRRLVMLARRFPTLFFAGDPWWVLREAGPCDHRFPGFTTLEIRARPFLAALGDLLPDGAPPR